MSDKWDSVSHVFLRRCPVCAAATDDPEAHRAWHERLRDAIENGMPVIDPVDQDR